MSGDYPEARTGAAATPYVQESENICTECPHSWDDHDWTGCTKCEGCPIVLMEEITASLTPHAEEARRD